MNQLDFTGKGTEYFKIWIVNILLTIITLGLYLPWAKVRTRRYFHANTHLDQNSFDYHATGKQLFISYIISVVLLIIYVTLSRSNPILSAVFAGILVFASPWIIWRSIKFNLGMISYRNVRFGFNGKLAGSYINFLAYPIGLVLGFALVIAILVGVLGSILGSLLPILITLLVLSAYPAFFAFLNKVTNNYFIKGASFGQNNFSTNLEFKPFFFIILKGIGLGLLITVGALAILGLLAYLIIGAEQISNLPGQLINMEQSAQPSGFILASIVLIYSLFLIIGVYIVSYLKTYNRAYIFSKTRFDETATFHSNMHPNELFRIHITNILLMIATIGLAYPWVKIRSYRYLTETIAVNAPNGFAGYVSQTSNEGAIGEELGEAFDIGGIGF